MTDTRPIIIVGGGLAGLACGLRLAREGLPFILLEAADAVGGRVRTDTVDGFLLDRGFQVLTTSYPEAQARLDYDALDLRTFRPGALVRVGGRFVRLADPWRDPVAALRSALNPVTGLLDGLRVARLRWQVLRPTLTELARRDETSTREALLARGFSRRSIERFWRPFLGGIFLERELTTSSRQLEFVFRMFARGHAALPAGGMEAIPRQLAAGLPADSVRTQARVAAIGRGGVTLASGERVTGRAVVIATEAPMAAALHEGLAPPLSRRVTCLYFDAPRPPLDEPILVLNGDGRGPVNNLCVPSVVAPSYAPAGRAVVSVSVIGDPDVEDAELEIDVRQQLGGWFGAGVEAWRLLRLYRIVHALPALLPAHEPSTERSVRLGPGLYVCGDHRDSPSIQGAMASGRRAAEALVENLAETSRGR